MDKCQTMIVLGSGGHTAEMMTLVSTLNPKIYEPRIYVCAKSDLLSQEKARSHVGQLGQAHPNLANVAVTNSVHPQQWYFHRPKYPFAI